MATTATKRAPARKIDTPTARAKLAPRRPPYWHKLSVGHFVGYRITAAGRLGHWIAKRERGGTCLTMPLGALESITPDKQFDAACQLARDWFEDLKVQGESAAPVQAHRVTLRKVLTEYVQACAAERPTDKKDPQAWAARKAREAERFFDGLVLPYVDAKGERWIDTPVAKLKPAQFQQWRVWVSKAPGGKKRNGPPRQSGTVNRYINTFRAALNRAKHTHLGEASQEVLVDTWGKAFAHEGDATNTREDWAYIPRDDRPKLVEAAHEVSPAFGPLVEVHFIAPIRPGAWTSMEACDYDPRNHRVRVRFDKANSGRYVHLPEDEACRELFTQAAKGKAPSALLFPNPSGGQWNCTRWSEAFRKATARAGLPSKLTLYCLRHTRITDLIDRGTPITTVAKIAGTSVAQIEKHYHHLTEKVARQALADY